MNDFKAICKRCHLFVMSILTNSIAALKGFTVHDDFYQENQTQDFEIIKDNFVF